MATCEPCLRNSNQIPAVKWCVECEEALCTDCNDAHRSMKALLAHRIVDISVAKNTSVSALMKSSNQVCKKHGNSKLDFYCSFHDTLCCETCLAHYHSTCSRVQQLDSAAKDAKKTQNTQNLLSQLHSIHGTLEEIRQQKRQNVKQIEEQEGIIRNAVSKLRQKVTEHLDVLERNLFDELLNLKVAATSQLKREARKIQQTQDLVKSHQEQIEFEIQNGSDKQTFIAVHIVKNSIIGIEEKVLQMKSRSGIISFVFLENADILENLSTFGSVSLKSNSKTPLHQLKPEENMTQQEDSIIQCFAFSQKFKTSPDRDGMITGIAVTDDNRLLLCGGGQSNIVVYTEQGKYLRDIRLAGEPWDVAVTREKDSKAVATLPYLNAVQFITVNSMAAGKLVRFDWRVYGVAAINKNIVVGGRNSLHILDLDGRKQKDIAVPSISIFYIHPKENGDLFYSDSTYVYCIKANGRHIFCQDLTDLEGPRNIVTDNRGNLYVAGHRSNTLHRLTPDGKAMDILLSKEDGIEGPFAICFSNDQSKLFVSNNNGKTITTYTTVYAPPSKEDELRQLLKYL